MRYPNLEAELKRKQITREQIAKSLNIDVNTVSRKLTGKSKITLDEALAIRKLIDENYDLKDLFQLTD